MQSLVAGHGQDAAHAAVQSVQPTLAALAARYDDGQGGTGWDGLAARLGYADAGSLIAGVAGQHLASPTPIATPPPSPTSPAPTIPAQLGARTADETRAVGNVAQMLTAAYGEAAIQQATQSVAPITSALASHLPATESTGGVTALAQSLGFPDAGRMAGALLEDHAMRAQGLTPPEHGALFGAPLPAMPATPDPAPPVTTTTPPNLALAAHALSLNTPPERPVPFDQVVGMRMAQNLNLPPNFGPVLSNLAWSLRAQSADPGLFWQVYQGAEEIGNDRGSAGGDSGDAYAAFRQFVDELYDRQGDGAPFHRPWRPGEQPLPGRRTT